MQRVEDAQRHLAFLEEVPLLFHADSPCRGKTSVDAAAAIAPESKSGLDTDQHGSKRIERKRSCLSVFIRVDPCQEGLSEGPHHQGGGTGTRVK
jgi:hypothetical protein